MAETDFRLSWCQGYDSEKLQFISDDTVCHICGSNVKFHSEDGSSADFSPSLRNVAKLAAQPGSRLFAIAESEVLNPKIIIYSHPSFKQVGDALEGAAQLEITQLAFSSSQFLYAMSGVPDFKLSLWDYRSGTHLASLELPELQPLQLAVNPSNWRLAALLHGAKVSLLEVERCKDLYRINRTDIRLPPVDAELHSVHECDQSDKSRLASRSSAGGGGGDGRIGVQPQLPDSSIAGLQPQLADEFQEYKDACRTRRMDGLCLAWSELERDLFVGCDGGCLLRYDGERKVTRVLLRPGSSQLRRRSSTAAPANAVDAIAEEQGEGEGEEEEEEDQQQEEDEQQEVDDVEVSVEELALTSRGLVAAGTEGCLRLLQFGHDLGVISASEIASLPSPIVAFAANGDRLAVGTSDGSVGMMSLGADMKLSSVYGGGSGNFVGLALLPPGNGLVATARDSGMVQIWGGTSDADARLVGSLSLSLECTAFAGISSSSTVLVGAEDGSLSIVDASKPRQPRLVQRHFLHRGGAVSQICVDPAGRLFATASSDGRVFVGSALASEKFKIIGAVSVAGCVRAISLLGGEDDKVQMLLLAQLPGDREPSRISFCELSQELCADGSKFFGDTRGVLADDHVKKVTFQLDGAAYGCVLLPGVQPSFFTVSSSTRQLLCYRLPARGQEDEEEEPDMPILNADIANSPEIFFEEPQNQLQMHASGRLLLAFGADGRIVLIDIDTKTQLGSAQAHSYTSGGVLAAAVSLDGKFAVSSGCDASLCRFNLRLSDSLATELIDWQMTQATDSMSSVNEENSLLAQMPNWSQSAKRAARRESESDDEEQAAAHQAQAITWLQEMEQLRLAEEDKKFSDRKRDLRDKLRQMRQQISEMVDANANEEELEKLDPHEFELDLDNQASFGQETEAEVAKVRKGIELDNLAKQFLTEVIKRNCWDEMEVKGRSINSFSSPVQVSNYPLRPLAESDKAKLEVVAKRRVIEISEAKDRRELVDGTSREQMLPETIRVRFNLKDGEEEDEVGDDKQQEAKEHIDSITLQGGTAERFGVLKSMFYSQFKLHSREQKVNQIVLLQDSIRHIKQGFNKEFDEVYKKKEQDMAKVRERNVRLKKIVSDLDLDTEVTDPNFSVAERPELLFTVSEEEVTVEKYLTPEQQKKLQEQRQAEEERLRRERLDNWRERGLDQMMGGVLEVKKEDELKKDIPKPGFMISKPDAAEWSEDEKRLAEDYDRRVKELQEEREKYRKQLEAELKKLQTQNEETLASFDQELKLLFERKVKTQAAVVQEELKIQRLRLSLLVEEEFGNRERELKYLIADKKQQLQQLAPQIDESRRLYKEQDNAILNQRSQNEYYDKNYSAFKREFPDASPVQIEQLHKLFKKKLPQQRIRAGASEAATAAATATTISRRPTTASKQESQRQQLDSVLREQDDDRNMPAGLDFNAWQRFCQMRRQRRERELELEDMSRAQSEFQAFVSARNSEYERLQAEAENVKQMLEQLMTQKAQFISNLEVQLLVRQGQVEVQPKEDFIIEFDDSLLLHRSMVEDLNSRIKSLGEAKVKLMEDARDSKKTFRRLEWELKGMRMEAEDLIDQLRDINGFKITREIQKYLATDDYDSLITSEIQKLDQAIDLMKKHHQRMVEMKEARLKEITEGKCAALEAKNQGLDQELEEMNVCVNERLHIDEVNAEKRDEAYAAQKRYEQILQRQRLVDLAKAQAKEVAVLRAEVERLRMRTFPALVHNK